ncbi:L,D-transpeptidase [Marinisporobacter balticus]|uniref:L,D-transpeptidase-like protein n=1 Tax=Marinisporobacter balticus TaxID=2018667 RepID=A0A4R2KEX7_9FIRM|nr:L,D-transpeptidase [Marinisporobacter balticus]TCO68859.1 L,D-transpeptidase-like protein [Marinisporobacter balticus]
MDIEVTDGKASTPTVKGNFTISGRSPWLTSYNGKVKAKYKVRFFGNYYLHSILFDSKGKNIVDSRLGQSLSHGCVRLSVDDAKWVYDNIKDHTGVYVN